MMHPLAASPLRRRRRVAPFIMPGLVPGILCGAAKRIGGTSPRMMRWGDDALSRSQPAEAEKTCSTIHHARACPGHLLRGGEKDTRDKPAYDEVGR